MILKAYRIVSRPFQRSLAPVRDRKYLSWLRTQPCAVCGSFRYIESAHTGARGLGQKADDRLAIPLCRGHHSRGNLSLHKLGPVRFALLYHLEMTQVIQELNEMYLGASCIAIAR